MSMNLIFSRPRETQTITIEWLEVETSKGNMVIQEGHTQSYVIVKPYSTLTWLLSTGATEKMHIGKAFLKIDRTTCLLIIDSE